MKSSPTCDRCLVPILAYEPYAILEISQRIFERDAVTVLDAFGIAELCRDCGERLQLTSPDVDEGVKLCRAATTIPAVQAALAELSPFFFLPSGSLEDPWEQCWSCAVALTEAGSPAWIECSLTFGRYTQDGPTQVINVLDYYATVCLCEDCCEMAPLPALDSYPHAYQWMGALTRMLES